MVLITIDKSRREMSTIESLVMYVYDLLLLLGVVKRELKVWVVINVRSGASKIAIDFDWTIDSTYAYDCYSYVVLLHKN